MKPWIIGHRGAVAYCHENTLESFQKAIEFGADGIEFDVRRTLDGRLIVHHDASVNGRELAGLSYSEAVELAAEVPFCLPLLQEVVELTAGKIRLDVELKEEGYEEDVVDLIAGFLDREAFFFTSFSLESMQKIRQIRPGFQTGLLANQINSDLIRTVTESGMSYFLPQWKAITPGWAEKMVYYDLQVIAWTVNQPPDMQNLLQFRCLRGLISDRPDLALQTRDNLNF